MTEKEAAQAHEKKRAVSLDSGALPSYRRCNGHERIACAHEALIGALAGGRLCNSAHLCLPLSSLPFLPHYLYIAPLDSEDEDEWEWEEFVSLLEEDLPSHWAYRTVGSRHRHDDEEETKRERMMREQGGKTDRVLEKRKYISTFVRLA